MFYNKGHDRDKHQRVEIETTWRFMDGFSEKSHYASCGLLNAKLALLR